MLRSLELEHLGPADAMSIEFGPRLNLITGDNGLGKSFLLDVAWWALTRTWARSVVLPHPPPKEPRIGCRFSRRSGGDQVSSSLFDREREEWTIAPGRPAIPGLVISAGVDGGFSVWDPARNDWRSAEPKRPAAYLFQHHEVWDGNAFCEGLIRDWSSWQREQSEAFAQLKVVLRELSPDPGDPMVPGPLRRLSLNDPRAHPTLHMSYGQDVALVHASAGMRRILGLSYLLVWAWREHKEACRLLGRDPTDEIILLVDEIEAHLHPKWQRAIVPALLSVMAALTGDPVPAVQIIGTTHSPLVLASVEPHFDEDQDRLFLFSQVDAEVRLDVQPLSNANARTFGEGAIANDSGTGPLTASAREHRDSLHSVRVRVDDVAKL